jgi:hypothetical protein
MGSTVGSLLKLFTYFLHRLAFGIVVLFTLGMILATVLSVTGYWPWLSVPVSFGAEPIENAGMYIQIALTALALMLVFFLPSNGRIMALENSHRSFSMGMQDVARAYHHAHAADRTGVFQLSSEFDSVRERLVYLRDHPDLLMMEPEILEMAAQMSHISRELSQTYSDENVARARDFLRQRQQEVERFNKRLDTAKTIHTELKNWLHQVELEESVAAAQLERLRDELFVILPEVGVETFAGNAKVIGLPRAAE